MNCDLCPIAVATFDQDIRLLHANTSFRTLFGVKDTDIIVGLPISYFLPDLRDNEAIIEALRRNGTFTNLSHSFRRKKRKRRKELITVAVQFFLRDKESLLASFMEVGIPLFSKELAEFTFANSSHWIAETDEKGVYTFTSEHVHYLLGKNPNYFIGKKIDDTILPEDRPKVRTILKKHQNEEKIESHYLKRMFGADGEIKIMATTVVSLFDRKGTLRGLREISKDITASYRKNKKLKAMEQQISDLQAAVRIILSEEFRQKAIPPKNISPLMLVVNAVLLNLEHDPEEIRNKKIAYLREFFASPTHLLNDRLTNLTSRELQIAGLIRDGYTSKEIASIMHMSSRTVENYRQSIRKKLGIIHSSVSLKETLEQIFSENAT